MTQKLNVLFLWMAASLGLGESIAADGTVWTVAKTPVNGVPVDRQFDTISQAVAVACPGDIIVVYAGVYRELVVFPKDNGTTAETPIRLKAAPGARVTITGTDRLTDWKPEPEQGDDVYSHAWEHNFQEGWMKLPHYPEDDFHRLAGRQEQVFADNHAVQQVLNLDKLERGTFYAGLESGKLYYRDWNHRSLRDIAIEAAVRGHTMMIEGDHIHVRGIIFSKAATRALAGMVRITGDHVLMEDCVFQFSNSGGMRTQGRNGVFRRCSFVDNGQFGFEAVYAHGTRFETCLTARNNTKGYARDWGAGGNKIVLCKDIEMEHCVFRDNRGMGLWFDIGNEQCRVRNCLFLDNEDAGLFYEISYSLTLTDSVFVGNGWGLRHGSWGANGGLSLSSSPDCVVERNLFVGNREGFQYREQSRTTPRLETPDTSDDKNPMNWLLAEGTSEKGDAQYWIWNHSQIFRNNLLAYNWDSQTWGWFSTDDERELPTALMKKVPPHERNRPIADIAADYVAAGGIEPKGRSLETLALKHENNFYAVLGNQRLFVWGCAWDPHEVFSSPAEVSEKLLGLETGSQIGIAEFADILTLDFRLPAGHSALQMGAYPRGEVPGVKLGEHPSP